MAPKNAGTKTDKKTAHNSQYIAWISLDNKRLACGELEQILNVSVETNSLAQKHYADPLDRIVTFTYNGDEARFQQLACTLRICKIIETVQLANLPETLTTPIDVPSYKVDFLNSLLDVDKETATKIYKLIYKSIKEPKIDVKSPHTLFFCHLTETTATIAKQVWLNDYAYEKRRSHLREITHSAVMHPKLMRTMINLSGIVPFADTKKQYKLLDPFCGTGNILIEAMHCGFYVAGNDIDPKMKAGAKINIANEIKSQHQQPAFAKRCDPNTDIKRISALEIEETADVIVTDVPYAKNTKKLEPPTLYIDFLRHVAAKKLAPKMVICMPNYANGEDIIKQTTWRIKEKFELPVHNSLTRELFILTLD